MLNIKKKYDKNTWYYSINIKASIKYTPSCYDSIILHQTILLFN